MEVVRTIAELRQHTSRWRIAGQTIGLIPTMGALHKGHLSLIKLAQGKCDRVIATIFVNPRQFLPNEDFDEYPRNEESDIQKLNEMGGSNGIGRLDIVENRYVGMKSRGVYETPGGTILLIARRAIESITLDKGSAHLKDEIMPRYAELIYNGYWFSPERELLQSLIDKSQKKVNGEVKIKVYKGNVSIIGRRSKDSLYSKEIATFDEDTVYDQNDAKGFIKLNALRLKILKQR